VPAPRVEIRAIDRDAETAYCEFACDGALAPLLWDERTVTLHCSEGVRLEPEALAAGALFALAPLGWICGAEIACPVPVAEEAVRCLDRVGEFLRGHYGWPAASPFRNVPAQPVRPLPRSPRALAFSGGIDSARALVELAPELDWLVHLSNFENLDSRMTPEQREDPLEAARQVARRHGLGLLHLKSNLAGIYQHNRFDDRFPPDCSFWLGLEHVQHLATALTVVQPLLARVFLAGGFSELHRYVGSCAGSSAFVDLYTFPAPLTLVHEFEMRQSKVEYLLDHAPELLRTLRVCYSSGDGTCGECRKCQATALMVLSAGGSLEDTSFPPRIVPNLIEKVRELSQLPAAGHGFYNQSLAGRALSGSREERWAQLLARLERYLPATS
jgi:hypothetical protein